MPGGPGGARRPNHGRQCRIARPARDTMEWMATSITPRADDARRLLLEHVDRTLTGPVADPAVVAAVVGVERLVVATGSTDAQTLRTALDPGHAVDEAVAEVAAEALASVATGLERRAGGEAADAGVVNPDAGRHEIVTDATLLRAGVRASQRSYDAMPYYRLRYGGRGARFASTDSAWLISLAGQEESHALSHVRWLARVLATRGMPTWLLEDHLGALAVEVAAVAGDHAAGVLPAAADDLATTRRQHVDDDLLARADAWAEEALGDDLPFRGTGLLLAAATADDLAGVTRDDGPLIGWLTYPERMHPGTAEALLAVRDRIRAAAH